jgi:Cu+-exporting ATPase
MTCAACARTIERTLAKTPGVERAKVNFATATATVEYDPSRVRPGEFVGAIEDLGYGVPQTAPQPDAEEHGLRRRFGLALAFTAPLVALGMSEAAPWLQLALALPVVAYAGAPFYAAA